ncbi:hypothetical protein CIB95_13075 [Lottiidibacillus patelloidae]|uniref:Uncharacterized protein n=1 Tax=Lottiidibacillus patelloidae TaxID=2670334 RepID=A0A263BRK8_9BACI|nr:hypothetical protein [Lottiidibacillus patelloidae]OZM56340.1 hypothetical protein CIB95_13075 [Lottiidibacillus patelloidae]
MKKREIYCEQCVGLIKIREDLVVASFLYYVLPYHEHCYAKALKGFKTPFLSNQPINGKMANLVSVLVFFTSLFIILFMSDIILKITAAIMGVYTIGFRLISWFLYERHLEK